MRVGDSHSQLPVRPDHATCRCAAAVLSALQAGNHLHAAALKEQGNSCFLCECSCGGRNLEQDAADGDGWLAKGNFESAWGGTNPVDTKALLGRPDCETTLIGRRLLT